MVTYPEFKWPDHMGLGDSITGGLRYYASGTRMYLKLGTVINVDMSDFNFATHTENNPLIKTIYNDSEGGKIELLFWGDTYYPEPTLDVKYIKGSGRIKSKTGTYTDIGSIYGISIGASYYYANVEYVKTHGVKVSLITDYALYGIPVDGITPADRVRLYVFVPNMGIVEYPDYTVSVSYDDLLSMSKKIEIDTEDPEKVVLPGGLYNGGCMFQGNAYGGIGYSSLGNWDDLNVLRTQFGSDPVKVETNSPDDPSQEEDPSGPGGGGGDMDPSSDPIDFPTLPSNGALSSGSIKVFAVSNLHLQSIFHKLWSTSIFDIATFQKLVEAPLDSLISLECVPITPTVGNSTSVMLGNFDTDVDAPVVSQQYYTVDFGTLTVKEYWGSALDYSPYTKAELYLPGGVGIVDVNIDDIMGKTLAIKYNYDILSGNFTAQVKCGQSVLYKFPGVVKETVPITARVKDAMQSILSGGIMLAGAAIGAGIAGAAAISTAVNVAMAKTHVSRSGSMNGSVGLLDDFTPYLILHRPKQSLAADFKSFKGYPSNITAILSSLSGYTEVEYIHLTGINGATDTELTEIENLLKNGVII